MIHHHSGQHYIYCIPEIPHKIPLFTVEHLLHHQLNHVLIKRPDARKSGKSHAARTKGTEVAHKITQKATTTRNGVRVVSRKRAESFSGPIC